MIGLRWNLRLFIREGGRHLGPLLSTTSSPGSATGALRNPQIARLRRKVLSQVDGEIL